MNWFMSRSASHKSPTVAFAWREFLAILMLCFVYAGSFPPGVNEPHYLSKAKHYWQPQWCAGDLFLESADAHAVFFWSYGWTTKFFSLTAAACIGRGIAWGLFAVAWLGLVREFSCRPWRGFWTAAIYLAAVQYANMSGEWVIGGIEGKSLAYPLLLLGLTAVVQGRWRAVFPWLGLASAFHVLVGGWAVLAAAATWFVRRRRDQLQLSSLVVPCAVGGAFALCAVLPALALTRGLDAQTTSDANIIYVYLRLPHHLVFHRFAAWHIARFGILTALACGIAWRCRGLASFERLALFTAASLVIALAGILIDQSLLGNFTLSASLLRYYWYRLADAVVPAAFAIGLLVWYEQVAGTERSRRAVLAACLSVAVLAACCAATDTGFLAPPVAQQQERWSLSVAANQGATRGSQLSTSPGIPNDGKNGIPLAAESDDAPAAEATGLRSTTAGGAADETARFEQDWQSACGWIRSHTPANAKFFTPMYQQTFKWYAERPELVTWKDVPQDARQLVAWWQLRRSVRQLGSNPLSDASELIHLAAAHGLTHVVWPSRDLPNIDRRIELIFRNDRFLVGKFLEVSRAEAAGELAAEPIIHRKNPGAEQAGQVSPKFERDTKLRAPRAAPSASDPAVSQL